MSHEYQAVLAVNVGNTMTRFAVFSRIGGAAAEASGACPTSDPADAARAITDMARRMADEHGSAGCAVVIASVNRRASEAVAAAARAPVEQAGIDWRTLGEDMDIPITAAVDDPSKVGQDRLLAALAAYRGVREACAVIDAGTAITVDFVDGEGTFQGGAIAPGVRMGLSALHRGTAQLPSIDPAAPGDSPFGKNTTDALINGVFFGARGLVRALVERYAEAYEAYPRVIACGGDAKYLFEGDELVEIVVPDLVLRGIAIASGIAGPDARPNDHDGTPAAGHTHRHGHDCGCGHDHHEEP